MRKIFDVLAMLTPLYAILPVFIFLFLGNEMACGLSIVAGIAFNLFLGFPIAEAFADEVFNWKNKNCEN